MTTSIIVEDNVKHSDRLKKLLAKTNSTIQLKETCSNINDALVAINRHKPKLVFLDIHLNGNNTGGFDILNKIDDVDFDVIFTTAHIDTNIREIRRCGLYYIVKPYVFSEIEDVIRKYEEQRTQIEERPIRTLKSNLATKGVDDKVIFINFDKCLYPVFVKEIIYCSSNDSLVTFIIKTENPELIKSGIRSHDVRTKVPSHKSYIEWDKHITMKALEADFADLNFCRIHNEFLVNMSHVKKFMPGNGGGIVKLSNDENLEVSPAGKKEFLRLTGRT